MLFRSAVDTSMPDADEVEYDQPDADEEVTGEDDNKSIDTEPDEYDGFDDDDEDDDDESESEELSGSVEIEFDGKKFKVPAEIKDAVMREQDYTHKTQALAEQRKVIEAEQQQFRQYAEVSAAHSENMANIAAIDQQLSQFQAYDWNAAYDADLASATKLRHQMEQLGQAKNALVQDVQVAEQKRQQIYNENLATTAKRTDDAMRSEIPNWGDELKTELGKFAVETMGFDAESVSKAVTPQEIKAIYYAQVGYKAIQAAKSKSAKSKQPVEAKKPPKAVKARRQRAPSDLSKISDPATYREAYMARKRKQG